MFTKFKNCGRILRQQRISSDRLGQKIYINIPIKECITIHTYHGYAYTQIYSQAQELSTVYPTRT